MIVKATSYHLTWIPWSCLNRIAPCMIIRPFRLWATINHKIFFILCLDNSMIEFVISVELFFKRSQKVSFRALLDWSYFKIMASFALDFFYRNCLCRGQMVTSRHLIVLPRFSAFSSLCGMVMVKIRLIAGKYQIIFVSALTLGAEGQGILFWLAIVWLLEILRGPWAKIVPKKECH